MNPHLIAFNTQLHRIAQLGIPKSCEWRTLSPTKPPEGAEVCRDMRGRSHEVRAIRLQVHRSNRVSAKRAERALLTLMEES